jgi:O-antigen ligase/tetratricopeptide (TPR) repeat protein
MAIFIKRESWTKLLKINLVVGCFTSLFALVQYFGFFSKIFTAFSKGAGTPSFIGNSTFLAIYMLFLVFISLTFFVQEKTRNKKIIYFALAILFIFTIILSGSRASYLGLLAGLFFYLIFYPKKIKLLKVAAASLLGLAITVVLIFNFFPQIGAENNLLKKVSSRLSVKEITYDLTGNRLPAWTMTIQAIKEKPLLGWGPENFYVGFEKYYSPTNDSLRKEWWDRPHNILLDVFISYGIFALILYISFWIVLLIKLQIFKKKEADDNKIYLAHGIQTMFLGYLIALLVNFDDFPTYLISFFFIGLSIYLISLHGDKKEILPPEKTFLSDKAMVGSLLILTLLFIWFWNIKPLYINEKIVWAENLVSSQKCDQALSAIGNTWQNSGILKTYAGLSYVDFITKCAPTNFENDIEYSKKALDALKTASKIQPKYSRMWLALGSFSNVLAAREQDLTKRKEILSEARGYLSKALELSPQRQAILTEFEINYLMAEDYKSAEKTAYDCIKIDNTQGVCNWYLGIAQIFLGDQVNGKKNIAESKVKGYENPALLQLGVAYLSQKNYKDAFDIYNYLAAFYHENAGYHAVTAVLAKELGDYGKAAKETVEVFRIQPNNPESLQFLENLFQIKSADPVVRLSLASVYKMIGDNQKNTAMLINAKNIYLNLIRDYPNNPVYHYKISEVYTSLGDIQMAKNEIILGTKLEEIK